MSNPKDNIQDELVPTAFLKGNSIGEEVEDRLYKTMKLSLDMDLKNKPLKRHITDKEQIKELADRVESLERLIRITFNGHILINGQFQKITI